MKPPSPPVANLRSRDDTSSQSRSSEFPDKAECRPPTVSTDERERTPVGMPPELMEVRSWPPRGGILPFKMINTKNRSKPESDPETDPHQSTQIQLEVPTMQAPCARQDQDPPASDSHVVVPPAASPVSMLSAKFQQMPTGEAHPEGLLLVYSQAEDDEVIPQRSNVPPAEPGHRGHSGPSCSELPAPQWARSHYTAGEVTPQLHREEHHEQEQEQQQQLEQASYPNGHQVSSTSSSDWGHRSPTVDMPPVSYNQQADNFDREPVDQQLSYPPHPLPGVTGCTEAVFGDSGGDSSLAAGSCPPSVSRDSELNDELWDSGSEIPVTPSPTGVSGPGELRLHETVGLSTTLGPQPPPPAMGFVALPMAGLLNHPAAGWSCIMAPSGGSGYLTNGAVGGSFVQLPNGGLLQCLPIGYMAASGGGGGQLGYSLPPEIESQQQLGALFSGGVVHPGGQQLQQHQTGSHVASAPFFFPIDQRTAQLIGKDCLQHSCCLSDSPSPSYLIEISKIMNSLLKITYLARAVEP